MKRCTLKDCDVPVSLQEFNKNKSRKDGLSNVCKVCSSLISKRHYHSNTSGHKQKVCARNKRVREDTNKNIIDILLKNPCTDCGNQDIRVLEFDHLWGKSFDISRMIKAAYSWATILQEIEKCEVVCSNCHRIRTYKRTPSYKSIYWEQSLLGKAHDF